MPRQKLRFRVLCLSVLLVSPAVTACGRAGRSGTTRGAWIDQSVTFEAGGMTIYATYRHPDKQATLMPAVLLMAGSGPTDRNGNSRGIPGSVGTLQTVAEWLSDDGVASLRYDKLGSGQTGSGPYASHPETVDLAPFEQEAAAALSFLAGRPGVDRSRLAVFGHSEGGLFALLMATGTAGPIPAIHAIGLLEPLSVRYLDLVSAQLDVQTGAAQTAGEITPAQAAQARSTLANAIGDLRTTGSVPPNLPSGISAVLNPTDALFLSQADRYDPGQLAAHVAPHLPVFVTCSDADIQVTCSEVDHLVGGLAHAPAATDFVHLTGVDHVLKQDPSGSGTNYAAALPFSPQLRNALRTFVDQDLQ
jgi:alpha-beta hydrolase superfamily lysophospholipase